MGRTLRAAAIETDKARLPELIDAAKGTLLLRLLDLTDGLEDEEELRARRGRPTRIVDDQERATDRCAGNEKSTRQ